MSVRVRFAPSPTGNVHIGNIRAAIFNWLFARHAGGKFLLRVEDTDRERSTQAAIDTLLDCMGWRGVDGDWRRGWKVRAKDGEMIPCAVICDAKALPYARKRIGDELKVKPYTTRFIDTTVAAPWFECYHPDHPMTRTPSKEYKMKHLQMISEEFGLSCGSETGQEASVPYCDYFEGMMSLGTSALGSQRLVGKTTVASGAGSGIERVRASELTRAGTVTYLSRSSGVRDV